MFVALLQGWRGIVPSSLLDNSRIFATVWRWECGAAGPPVVIVSTGSCSVTELGAGARTRSQGTYFAMKCKYYGSKKCVLTEHSLSKTSIFFLILDKIFTPEALGRGCRSGQRYVERRPGPDQSCSCSGDTQSIARMRQKQVRHNTTWMPIVIITK